MSKKKLITRKKSVKTKVCTNCGEAKTYDNYYYDEKKDYYAPKCKDCHRLFRRARHQGIYSADIRGGVHLNVFHNKCTSSNKRAKDGNRLIAKELSKLFDEQDGRCGYCLEKIDSVRDIQVDHRIPLSRGGSNTIDNIVITCRFCNRMKYNKTDDEFFEKIGIIFRKYGHMQKLL